MIILHAGDLGGDLLVWAEQSGDDYEPAPGLRSRRRVSSKPKKRELLEGQHPFSADYDEIIDAFDSAKVNNLYQYATYQGIWLPSKDGVPLPSSKIISDEYDLDAEAELALWQVPTIRIITENIPRMLGSVVNKRVMKTGVIIGTDLAYWADALRLAASMVARQQFLPNVSMSEEQYWAVWDPVFASSDSELLDWMARCMPASCRAFSKSDREPPKESAISILGLFLARVTNQLVRKAVSDIIPSGRTESMHDTWLRALCSGTGRMNGRVDDRTRFIASVGEWRRPVSITTGLPLRFIVRLDDPDEDAAENEWQIRFFMQPRDDSSLLVPVEEIWKGQASIPGTSVRITKEFLLSSLGQISSISPSIAAGLESGLKSISIDMSTAYKFLSEEAPALEHAGYGVMLPAWWTGRGAKKLTARARIKRNKMQGGGGISLEMLVKFDWELALEGQKITIRDLEKLAAMKVPLVRVRGQWLEVGGDEIQKAIKFFKERPKEATLRDVVMMGLGGADAPDGVEISVTSASRPISDMLEKIDDQTKLEYLKQPEDFVGTLREYQERGYSWLSFLQKWGLGGCLADDMGLGKTVQVLALAQQYTKLDDRRPILLVCPTSVIANWRKEAARFTPKLPVMIHHGADRKRGLAFQKASKQHALVVSSYGLLHRDKKHIEKMRWGGIVLDEAQNIKNANTKQAQIVRSLEADFRFALTGTPVENNVGDLWSIMEFLNPGLLGTQAEFMRNFFTPIQTERDPSATARLKRVTGPFILRRLKTDKSVISDLPEKMEMKVYCQLTREQASLYAAILEDMETNVYDAEGIKRRGAILGVLSKLKQVCNHPAQFTMDNYGVANRSGKIVRLTEMLAELIEVGDRALVFTQFVEMGHILKRYIQDTFGFEVPFLHGGTSRTNRDRMVSQFQEESNDGPQVFILSLRAGGTGLNLIAANHVFHFDRWWNPAVENQATDRAFRIGQKKNVMVHKLVCSGTLEEKIDEMIERKKEISENVVGDGEGWLTELSNEDLRQVLALDPEVTGI